MHAWKAYVRAKRAPSLTGPPEGVLHQKTRTVGQGAVHLPNSVSNPFTYRRLSQPHRGPQAGVRH